MAEQKKNEEMERELLDVQLQTARLGLERQKEENQIFVQTREQRNRQNEQRQRSLAAEAANKAARQTLCLHRQGGGPDDTFEGDGKSALTLSRIFFANNFLIQCPRCDLALQRPHPALKSKKARRLADGTMETAEMIAARIRKYNEDMTYYNRLLAEAKGNKLRPMLGPTWEFADEDGTPFVPELR